MNTLYKILIITMMFGFVCGCATKQPLTFDQIRGLKRGDSLQYVHGILKNTATDDVHVEYMGKKYLVEFMKMETGSESIPIPIIIPPFYGLVCYDKELKENYVYMYKEYDRDEYKLYDWGFIPDLNKSDSEVTRHVVIEAEAMRGKQQQKGGR